MLKPLIMKQWKCSLKNHGPEMLSVEWSKHKWRRVDNDKAINHEVMKIINLQIMALKLST